MDLVLYCVGLNSPAEPFDNQTFETKNSNNFEFLNMISIKSSKFNLKARQPFFIINRNFKTTAIFISIE
jgi:hypothetical protein